MNHLPAIEELADCRDDAERARWLLECPMSILLTYSTTIRNRLLNARFSFGLDYLDAEISAARAMRRDGLTVLGNPLRADMMTVAAGGKLQAQPAPDHAITEL